MATSSTSTFELSRDQLIKRAYQLAGLLDSSHEPNADDIALAADMLGMELLALQAEGLVVTHVTRTTLALVAATAEYSLPTDTLDVFIDANNFVGTIVPTTGTETPLRAISRSEYVAIPDKTTSATPSLVYIERLSTVKVLFWPVPDEVMSYRYQQIRFPRDVDTGAVTVDYSKRWQLALCYLLAYRVGFAKSLPQARLLLLKQEAEELKARARMSDVEKAHMQMFPARYY